MQAACPQDALGDYRRDLRSGIARELHDGPARELAIALARLEEYRSLSPDDRMQAAISTVEEHMRATMVGLRRIVNDLRDEVPEEHLPETVEALLRRYEETFDIEFTLVASPSWPRALPPGSALHILRVIEEAVANAIRHGAARRVLVELQAADGELVVAVHDDGRGIDPVAIRTPGFGITGMLERAALIGGSLRISRRRPGTTVVLTVPIRSQSAAG